ncbi:uncharacterized protein PADG_07944 [Paracoccidioides brasiliensis Pb18]|uniref:FAD dependent oxidoreductase domain-containing protein n=1 Tax=Paracoccidioides brasiliensis (strain Pb18) TaxID=502780 RepID=C1GKT7_PARBD|nr:uncharacterized protein PADG_07944 [Paracoccidioides brasiliensis Pb18]EEH43124.2 hypothetical protein PADG_07944 [Paracoccidioides brasiliensis Pb18]
MANPAKQTVVVVVVVVIGAGVIGVSSALTLLETLPRQKYHIILVSEFFSTDGLNPSYPSTLAGAHYRPIPATTPRLEYEAKLGRTTYNRFKQLAAYHPEFGVKFMEGIDYVSGEAVPSYKALLPDYTSVDGFRILKPSEMPEGVEFGARYESYSLDPEVYMVHLLRRFKLAGGEVRRMHLNAVEEAFEINGSRGVRMVVNCTGVGINDPKSFIIKGQACLVSNPCDKTITRQLADGRWSFLVPRPLNGGTVVGGTKQPNDWNPEPSPAVREQLLEDAANLYPAILNKEGKFDVIRDILGRRPAREGDMRLELETLPNDRNVIHAYGVAGRGFELSWGIAGEVLKMAHEVLDMEQCRSKL